MRQGNKYAGGEGAREECHCDLRPSDESYCGLSYWYHRQVTCKKKEEEHTGWFPVFYIP